MFRSFALTLAMALSAASVLFLVIGKAATDGEAIFPALPQKMGQEVPGARSGEHTHKVAVGESLSTIASEHYGDRKAWMPIASANGLKPPYVLHAGQILAVPGVAAAAGRPSEQAREWTLWGLTATTILQILAMYVVGVVAFGGIILDQSARILEVQQRSLGRATVAMVLSSISFLCALVMAAGLAMELDPVLGRSWAMVIGYVAGAGVISILAILAVMKYTFHTTTGKAMFLLVSYRFALAFSLITTALSAWLVLSGRLASGIESVARMLQA